jgi:hypothetical protein
VNVQQTTELLVLIQIIDNRRVDEAVVIAWHELLDDVEFDAAREALKLHRRESTEWVTPAHVRANVTRILHADRWPTDEYGNALERDEPALEARERLTDARRAVTA